MADGIERRQNTVDLQVDLARVDAKVDRIEQKIDSGNEMVRATIKSLTDVLDERGRRMEQRFDLTERQQQQSIDLLQSANERFMANLGAMETKVNFLESDIKQLRTKLDEQKIGADNIHEGLAEETTELKTTMQWWTRSLALALITAVIAVAVFYIQHPT